MMKARPLSNTASTWRAEDYDLIVFGMFVDAARIRNGWGLNSLAHAYNIIANDIYRAVAGKPISEESFDALCQFLGRDRDFFLIDRLKAKRGAGL